MHGGPPFTRLDGDGSAESTARTIEVDLRIVDGFGAIATPPSTPDPAGPLAVTTTRADAPGTDRENPNGESVVFENTGDRTFDLSRGQVRDEGGHPYGAPAGGRWSRANA